MRSIVARAALGVALLAVLGTCLTACGPRPSVGSPAAAPVAVTSSVASAEPVVLPHGVGHQTYNLGNGVRVFAFWTAGEHDVPWAINVHGGSWRYGSGAIPGYLDWARHEAGRGWAAFTIDYRLVPKVSWPAPEQDVERAVDWVREHASHFGLSLRKGFLIGHSAGGQLASIAALQLGGFAGVADISGAVDPYYIYRDAPDHALRHNVALLLHGRVDDWSLWASTRAETYLGRHVMPFLVMHSVNDPIVPEAVGRSFADALDRHGYPTTFVEVPGRVHNLSSNYDNSVVDDWMQSVLQGQSSGA